ncbi:MAG: hypothetical protein U5K00_17310 [Melioribacteraceae bacterium]|nr:hypothetical protein [Melioribacteraceae bacterium]
MTGRSISVTFYIHFPLLEIKADGDWLGFDTKLEKTLIYGSYPEIYESYSEKAVNLLYEISSSYLI